MATKKFVNLFEVESYILLITLYNVYRHILYIVNVYNA